MPAPILPPKKATKELYWKLALNMSKSPMQQKIALFFKLLPRPCPEQTTGTEESVTHFAMRRQVSLSKFLLHRYVCQILLGWQPDWYCLSDFCSPMTIEKHRISYEAGKLSHFCLSFSGLTVFVVQDTDNLTCVTALWNPPPLPKATTSLVTHHWFIG